MAAELDSGPLAQQTQATDNLAEITRRIKTDLGDDVIDADGNLDETLRTRPIGAEYLEAQAAAADSSGSRAAVEAGIYNHLYTFFGRYYEEGDFISKRRYSRNHRYAIPHNGEEIYLHWANSDQYYVKTEEHFRNYDWMAPNGVAVHFRIRNADVEQNNVKGDRRFFIPRAADAEGDADAKTITVPFVYRPLSSRESTTYGTRNQQDNIIREAVSAIPKQLGAFPEAIPALSGEHRRNGNDPISLLEHHLQRYVRRNNSDFFIHKDLSGFLNRELDFYLKNEVLNLDNIANAGQAMAEGWFQQLRLTKTIGGQIIDFLAQIEGFQKILWEKRKFVTEAQYCITLGNIAASYYPDIVDNEAQWDEWRDMLGVGDTQRSEAFLQGHPTLMLDTRHFDQDFTDRLLASFPDLDGVTDGLLAHGDNWQALCLMQEKYNGGVNCIYIDPPYNTAASEIIYKNGYKHSSWLSLMAERIGAAQPILDKNAPWVIAIDDTEMVGLSQLIDSMFTAYDRNMVVINHHPAGSGLEGTNVSSTHEYALFMTPTGIKALRGVEKTAGVSEIGFGRTGTANSNLRSGRPNSFYAVLVEPSTSTVVGAEPPPSGDNYPRGATSDGSIRIYPVSDDGTERVWRRSYKTIASCIERGEVVCKNGKSLYLRTDQTGKRRPLFSNWTDTKYNAGVHGSNLLKDIFGDGNMFPYPKSINTVRDCVDACTHATNDATVLDYFAGSGTTGHAVINLNREDGGERKFILVEMGHYFDTVLLPRIKKATFTPEWKEGKPQREATAEEVERSPRIVKYIRLESYEDALDSIQFDQAAGQLRLAEPADEYLLKYMLRWETKDSETLLNTTNLTSPFNYRLWVQVNGEKQERYVDLPETFNFLLGLNVRTRRAYDDGDRTYLVYRGETTDAPGREAVVIWRETEGWNEDDFIRDHKFVADHIVPGDGSTVFVNGDSAIPNAKPIEPIFKARMFAGTGA